MKKALIAILLIMISTVSFSRLSLNPQFSYTNETNVFPIPMYGLGIEMDIMPNLAAGISSMYGTMTKNPNEEYTATYSAEKKYSQHKTVFYLQYRYQILDFPLFAIGGLSGGLVQTKYTKDRDTATSYPENLSTKSDSGPVGSINLGLCYDISQNISAYITFDYFRTFYSGTLLEENVAGSGKEILFGFKLNVFGGNSDIQSGY